MTASPDIAEVADTGSLGVCFLKRYWSLVLASRAGRQVDLHAEWPHARLLLYGLGVGLHQALDFLYDEGPDFDAFEAWIVALVGEPDPLQTDRLNCALLGRDPPRVIHDWISEIESMPPVLGDNELESWQAYGYLVLKSAVDVASLGSALDAILEFAEASLDDPASWYRSNEGGIMLEFIQHPALRANRYSRRIHKAYAQLWGTADLWVSADRCSFHPPQRSDYPFPGPDLHWDIDFAAPPAFGTQGILYLTDTGADQGALTLVPGFHKRFADWSAGLPAGSNPGDEDLHALGSIPVPGEAGDLIIWHPLLPHGSRPNLASLPRIVQYVNYYPMQGHLVDESAPATSR